MQSKTAHNDSLIARGGLHSISYVSHLESKIVVLENMLKGLSPQMTQLSQTSTVSCSHCQVLDHSLSACPYFAHQLAIGQEKASMAIQRPKNDPFFPYYNPGWRNYPNSLGVMNQMLWLLTPNLECFVETAPSPSLIPHTPFRDQLFQVCLMHLDLHFL